MEFNRFYPLSKKQQVGVVIVFNAVPTGVEKLSYAEPAFIYFENIPIYNPDTSIHTDWDEQSLRSYWQKTEFPKMKAYMNFLNATIWNGGAQINSQLL